MLGESSLAKADGELQINAMRYFMDPSAPFGGPPTAASLSP
jgi:hypothetical protein